MKKAVSLILAFAMLFAIVVQAGGVPTQRMQIKVIADKTEVKAGDTVNFTVVLGPVSHVGSIQMSMDIPAGLTYVDGSGSVAEGARAAMGFDMLEWTENSYTQMINGSASAANYQSDSDLVLGTFTCTVDDDASGTLSVGVKDLEIGDCLTFEVFTEMFDIVPADLTVAGDLPVAEPTAAPATHPVFDPTTQPEPAQRMQIKVIANKTQAAPGDTVNFSVVLGPVSNVGSIQIFMDIPAGLTYVEESGSIAGGVVSAMGFDMLEWTENSNTQIINGSASAANYQSDTDTTLATFACTVDDDASGTLSVGITNLEIGDCQTFEVFTELFDVIAADVAVVSAPIQRPTTPPTERPTQSSTPHRHRLTRVREVPATEDSEGIKAHYICDGDNGCGKIFQDFFGTIELTEEDLIIPRLVPATETPATMPIVNPTTAPVTQPVVIPTTAPVTQPVVVPTIATEPATEAEPIIGPTMPPTPAQRMQIKVIANKTQAAPGDTVNFSVVLGPVSDIGSVQMFMDIPDGLTYVENSGRIAGGVVSAMGFDILDWTEKTLLINGSASSGDYASTSDLTIATFSCTVEYNASGTLTVGLSDLEMGSCVTFEVFTELFDVITADVTIVDEPTVAPEPETELAPEPEIHIHKLTFVEEIPATYESDGVKAHYICAGDNGCGKIFEDAFAAIELTEADLIIPRLVRPTEAPVTEPVVIPTDAPVTEPVVEPTTAPDPVTEPATEAEPIIGPTMPPTPAQRMQIKVVADKSEAEPGDTVNFSVVLGPVSNVGSVQMSLDIPTGLTYIEGSGIIADGAKSAMGFDILDWTEKSLMINGSASSGDYASTSDLTIATFSCTVDYNASGTLTVGLSDLEMGSCVTFEVFTELFDVITADVTIVDEPTAAPTEEATEELAPEPEIHIHKLTFVEEIPATYESDGVKAHYICDGDDGCGKIFEDAFATIELTEADLIIPRLVRPTEVPATEPVVEPTTAPVTEPVIPTTAPTEPVTEPETEPATEAEPIIGPTMPPATEPVVEPTTVVVPTDSTEPVVEPTTATESVVEPTTEPTVEPTTEPVTEPVTEPTVEPATEPATEPTVAPTEPDHPHCTDKFFIRFDAASAGWYCSRSVWCCIYEIGSGKQINACYYGMLPGFACGSIWTFNASCMGVKEGRQYAVVFKNGWSETYPLVMDSSCNGCTAHCTGKWIENPYSFCRYSPEVRWENSSLGPLLQITSYGKVIGETCPCNTTKYDMFVRFLTTVRRSGCVYGKKLNDIINSTARDLGL